MRILQKILCVLRSWAVFGTQPIFQSSSPPRARHRFRLGLKTSALAPKTAPQPLATQSTISSFLIFCNLILFSFQKINTKKILSLKFLINCLVIFCRLVFSQSLYSLTLIEQFLSKIDEATQNSNTSELLENHTGSWSLGLDYFRLDGQTSAENRSQWCKIFNRPTNTRARLFLISTRAGGLGINLTAANRVIIFDASWNPSHDVQSIFRIYRCISYHFS